MSVPDYYNRVNEDLLKALPAAGRIVEVGCGAGAMGHAHKQAHPGVEYIGLERHPEAAALAATRLDRVIPGDVETLADPGLAEVDCLVYGDVLEHLADPWAVLARHTGWLAPSGHVLACIPNVQHWSMLIRLLTGQWLYESEGLMDRTHLRFFSLETIRQLFQSAGLTITELYGRPFGSPDWDREEPKLHPLLAAAGVAPEEFARRSRVLQYVIRAVKPSA